MFDGRLRRVVFGLAGLYAVFLCRVLYLESSGAEEAREAIEDRRTTRWILPPRRGAIRDVDGRLLAEDEVGFDLRVETRALGSAAWRCPKKESA